MTTEDTVLFTAQAYMDAQQQPEQRSAAQEQLAQLVRCPYLSRMWLYAHGFSHSSKLLLQPYGWVVQELLGFLQATPWDGRCFLASVQETSASWLRNSRPGSIMQPFVEMRWELPVDELKQACKQAHEDGATVTLSHPGIEWPLLGLKFGLLLGAMAGEDSVSVGVFASAGNAPYYMYSKVECLLTAPGISRRGLLTLRGKHGRGFGNVFGVGHMAAGWDEAAWGSRGLPTAGFVAIDAVFAIPGHLYL